MVHAVVRKEAEVVLADSMDWTGTVNTFTANGNFAILPSTHFPLSAILSVPSGREQ